MYLAVSTSKAWAHLACQYNWGARRDRVRDYAQKLTHLRVVIFSCFLKRRINRDNYHAAVLQFMGLLGDNVSILYLPEKVNNPWLCRIELSRFGVGHTLGVHVKGYDVDPPLMSRYRKAHTQVS